MGSTSLDAGDGYTGGRVFFVERRAQLVRSIPPSDIGAAGNPPATPPDSLLEALRVFFVGVALAYRNLGDAAKNRSMLVHPSPQRADHDEYYKWVVNVCARWKETLELAEAEPEVHDLALEFEPALAELRGSGAAVPSFGDLRENLAEALAATLIHKVNSETGTEVDWSNAYSHILVGGQKLNRGYTVEGLTVTYMPRSAGTWTADTIQQLGRFFGYKRGYLDLCRAYLNPDLLDVFEAYIDHEEDIRRQLREHPGRLKDWTRALYLNARMRPTRQQLLTDPYYRVDPTQWIVQVAPFDDAILAQNRALVAGLYERSAKSFVPHPLAPDKHRVIEIRLQDLMDLLLFPYRVVGDHDEAGFYAARHLLLRLLQLEPDALASVVQMGSAARLARGAEIVKLHQGYDRKTMGQAYPGAGKIHDQDLVTIQIHDLTVRFEGQPDIANVPTLAIRLPMTAVTKTMIVQPTPPAHART